MNSNDFPDLIKLSLCDLAAALARGEVTSLQATGVFLDRLEGPGRALKALARLDREGAASAAELSDRRRQDGAALGPIDGVPLAHKDMFYRAGQLAQCGSAVFADFRPARTAQVLRRLDRAGAFDIARLNMVEFALGITGDNEMTGMPVNPWDPGCIPGGSSSGSAVAVAAGLVPAALGSDTGGSIRLPAACCGLVGLKTTMGRIDTGGCLPLSFTLDTIGPLTRSCADAAALFHILAERPPAIRQTAAEFTLSGCRIGWPQNYFFEGVAGETRQMLESVAARFRALGCEIVPLYLPAEIAHYNDWAVDIIATEAALFHAPWRHDARIGRQTRLRLQRGVRLAPSAYLAAIDARLMARSLWQEQVWPNVDFLLTPILTGAVPKRSDLADPDSQAFLEQVLALARASRPVNFLGCPALVMPASGWDADRDRTARGPIPPCFQLVGPDNSEERLLAAGSLFEEARAPVAYPMAL